MQKPTNLSIKEQVLIEVDKKLRQVAEEFTSKKPSSNKSKNKKRKQG